MVSAAPSTFTIRRVDVTEAQAVHSFHVANIGEFLWPRPIEQIVELVEQGSLWLAIDSAGAIAGICYVREPEDDPPEFGGVFVREDCRGAGLARHLARAALAAYLVITAPSRGDRLVSHVHEENQMPRRLLSGLGFSKATQVRIPAEAVPATMRRNSDGTVTGDEYELDYGLCCGELADWLESVANAGAVTLGGSLFNEYRADTLEALRDLARTFTCS